MDYKNRRQIGLNRLYRLHSDELTLLLKQAKELVHNHNPSLGYVGEEILRVFLSKILPERYKVTQGFVEHEGYLSPQCDVIIYDSLEHSPLYSFGYIDIVPSKAVKATVEIKTSINRPHFCKVLKSFEELYRMRVAHNYLFVFESPTAKTFENYFACQSGPYDVDDYEQLPDAIVSLNHNFCLAKNHVQDSTDDYYGYAAEIIEDKTGQTVSSLQLFIQILLDGILPVPDDDFPCLNPQKEERDDDLQNLYYSHQFPICSM